VKNIARIKKSPDGVAVACRLLGLKRRKQNITVVIAEKSCRLEPRLLNGEGFLQIRNAARVAQQDLEV